MAPSSATRSTDTILSSPAPPATTSASSAAVTPPRAAARRERARLLVHLPRSRRQHERSHLRHEVLIQARTRAALRSQHERAERGLAQERAQILHPAALVGQRPRERRLQAVDPHVRGQLQRGAQCRCVGRHLRHERGTQTAVANSIFENPGGLTRKRDAQQPVGQPVIAEPAGYHIPPNRLQKRTRLRPLE